MNSPNKETDETSSTHKGDESTAGGSGDAAASEQRPPAKRHISTAVIEISDTESDDSDVCAVKSYQASADEVKRIRRDYTSSSSSSSDYSSDSDSPWEDDSVVIKEKVKGKLVRAQLNTRANRMDDPKLNPALKSQEVIDKVKRSWEEEKEHTSDEVTLTCSPFRLCRLHRLLENPDIINNIVDDMNTLDWSRKKMDLYEFHQTTDLANLTWQRSIRGIYEMLKTEIMSWVSQVTGLELTSVSASCSLYGPGDHLLVHDDRLGDRRVAFILYLAPWTPRKPPQTSTNIQNGAGDGVEKKNEPKELVGAGWAAHMGGALELFASRADEPSAVELRAFPANNTLAFFQVGPTSFHQVSEVLSLELPRLSINGWFHGPGETPEPAPQSPPPVLRPHNKPVVLSQWLEATYMSARVRAQVQAQMERASEVCLRDFLRPERCDALLQALESPEVEWEAAGPPHQRRYERVSGAWLERCAAEGAREEARGAGVAAALAHALRSGAWLRLLAELTDLPLTGYRALELQRWAGGAFSLLPPRAHYAQARLHTVLYVGAPARALSGGHTAFVAVEEEAGALVTLPPAHNALSLVYCDAGAAAFTKYLSRLSVRAHERFYIVACQYTE